MSQKEIQVTAVAHDGGSFTVECSECGPVGVVDNNDVHEECIDHMRSHAATNVTVTDETSVD
jgi:hypothetical protein